MHIICLVFFYLNNVSCVLKKESGYLLILISLVFLFSLCDRQDYLDSSFFSSSQIISSYSHTAPSARIFSPSLEMRRQSKGRFPPQAENFLSTALISLISSASDGGSEYGRGHILVCIDYEKEMSKNNEVTTVFKERESTELNGRSVLQTNTKSYFSGIREQNYTSTHTEQVSSQAFLAHNDDFFLPTRRTEDEESAAQNHFDSRVEHPVGHIFAHLLLECFRGGGRGGGDTNMVACFRMNKYTTPESLLAAFWGVKNHRSEWNGGLSRRGEGHTDEGGKDRRSGGSGDKPGNRRRLSTPMVLIVEGISFASSAVHRLLYELMSISSSSSFNPFLQNSRCTRCSTCLGTY